MAENDSGNWGRHVGLGLQLVVGVLLGFWAGQWLDRKLSWKPWGTAVGSMLGFSAGLYLMLKEVLKANQK